MISSELRKNLHEANKIHDCIQKLCASSSARTYGSFHYALFEVDIDFSEISDTSDLETQNKRKQVIYHEFMHMFQAVSMPRLSSFMMRSKNKLKVDTAVLLKSAEHDKTWKISLNRFQDILQIYLDNNVQPPEFIAKEINRHYPTYTQLAREWVETEYKGLNVESLLEGMAHVFSLISTGVDKLGIETNEIYTRAYDFFLKSGGKHIEGHLTRRIVFCYFCYFSFQTSNSAPLRKVLEKFVIFCENLPKYFAYLNGSPDQEKAKDLCKKLEVTLGISIGNVNEETLQTLAYFMSFADAMDQENSDSDLWSLDLLKSNEFVSLRQKGLPKSWSIPERYFLIFLVRFPSLFLHWANEMRNNRDVKFQLGDGFVSLFHDQELMKFVHNFRDLINEGGNAPWCCPEHGYESRRAVVLECDHPDSFANIFRELTNKKLYERVRW